MAMEGRMIPAGTWRPKVAEARRMPRMAERRRRVIGAAVEGEQRPRGSSDLGEHSWNRFATRAEGWGRMKIRG